MQVEARLPINTAKPCVLALGNFDGVHLGHRRLLENGIAEAKRRGIAFSVLVFEPHPYKVLFPERELQLLTTQQEQLNIFEAFGVEVVYVLPFSPQTAEMSPERFGQEVVKKLGAVHVIVGFNYSFGAQGKGDSHYLLELGRQQGFEVSVLPAQMIEGKVISSSSIRKALLHGDLDSAKQMLGHAPCLCGVVGEGEKRGRLLGYPTANLKLPLDHIVPKRGVYAVWMQFNGTKIPGMMNIGMKPTFHDVGQTTIEVHFLDFNANLYGKEISVYLEERIRDERKFTNIDDLKRQLAKDAKQVSEIFKCWSL